MIRFGPSGNSKAFYEAGNKSSTQAPAWLERVGLNAYEYSFGRGVMMSDVTAEKLGVEAESHGIALSVHAPYFINFASPEQQKVENSFGYVMSSLAKLRRMGGSRCIIHTASCGKLNRADVLARCADNLRELADRMRAAGYGDLTVCPETMGKYSQIGTAEEIIDLCALDPLYVPCFDFGHINCYMQGGLNSRDAYARILEYGFAKLGEDRIRNMHVHFSRIQYGKSGEIRHLDFTDEVYGPDFEVFADAIVEFGLTPTVICESSEVMAEDAMKMRDIFYDRAGQKR